MKAPPQSGAGQTAQNAEQGVDAAQPAAPAEDPAAAEATPPADGTTPPADGSVPAAGDEPSPSPPGLVTIPLVLTFNGGYFALTDLLHRFKRFVRVVNDQVVVKGRLMTVDGIAFEAANAEELNVTMNASVYVVPKEQGATAGATPSGPPGAPPVAPTGETASVTPPTAAVTQ